MLDAYRLMLKDILFVQIKIKEITKANFLKPILLNRKF